MKKEVEISELKASKVAVVIFVSRESLSSFFKTLNTTCEAIKENSTIDVLVNGNPALANEIKNFIHVSLNPNNLAHIRLWSLGLGDKANTWNTYFHRIWNGEDLVFFIDGYVRLQPCSLLRLMQSIKTEPRSFGGTGVPTAGRSAIQIRTSMLSNGGFHGNFCCIRGKVISELRKKKINIPLGLYRVDSLVGAILYFGLNPKENEWKTYRIVVDGSATWDVDTKHWWRWTDVKAKLNQSERQLRGMVENSAVKYFFNIEKELPQNLPVDCHSLIEKWRQLDIHGFRRFLLKHPFAFYAYRRHRERKTDWSKKEDLLLIASLHPNQAAGFKL